MLPDLRFVLGALMVIALTGMIGVGLFVSARLFHQAKIGPLESRRNLAFTDSAEWNQFYDAGSVRRFVGLARQGEAREITDLPPEHRPEQAPPAALTVVLAPLELPKQEDGIETTAVAVRPPIADTADSDVATTEKTATVAAPSMPDQVRATPAGERSAVLSRDAVADSRPRAAETTVAHVAPVPLRSEPSAAEEREPAATQIHEANADPTAGAIAVETENGWDQEPWDMTPGAADAADRLGEPATPALTANVAPAEQQQSAAPMAAPQPSAALAKAAAPVPATRAPVRRSAPDDDDDGPRAASPVRPRSVAVTPRTAPQASSPQRGIPSTAPRRQPPGQPVFGPYFPYATAQEQQRASRVPQHRGHAQPSYDPRQFATQPAVRQSAPRQPSYSPAYGWR